MSDYRLHYWPIPFRGHFIRFVLATAGVGWDEADAEAVDELRDAAVVDQPVPFMAPPLLTRLRDGRSQAQLPAILTWLGRDHDLSADPVTEVRVMCDACDILLEITCHHGLTMWDRANWRDFRTVRLRRWLAIHDRLVREERATPYLFDRQTPGIADLTLTALWHTMGDRLPGLRRDIGLHAPALTRLVDRGAATPAVAGVIDDWHGRRPLYCGGQIEASLLDMLEKDHAP